MLVADGEEFTVRDANCLLAISTQTATELGCVVHPEDAHDTADILISIGSP
jgi:hypothetical protein